TTFRNSAATPPEVAVFTPGCASAGEGRTEGHGPAFTVTEAGHGDLATKPSSETNPAALKRNALASRLQRLCSSCWPLYRHNDINRGQKPCKIRVVWSAVQSRWPDVREGKSGPHSCGIGGGGAGTDSGAWGSEFRKGFQPIPVSVFREGGQCRSP